MVVKAGELLRAFLQEHNIHSHSYQKKFDALGITFDPLMEQFKQLGKHGDHLYTEIAKINLIWQWYEVNLIEQLDLIAASASFCLSMRKYANLFLKELDQSCYRLSKQRMVIVTSLLKNELEEICDFYIKYKQMLNNISVKTDFGVSINPHDGSPEFNFAQQVVKYIRPLPLLTNPVRTSIDMQNLRYIEENHKSIFAAIYFDAKSLMKALDVYSFYKKNEKKFKSPSEKTSEKPFRIEDVWKQDGKNYIAILNQLKKYYIPKKDVPLINQTDGKLFWCHAYGTGNWPVAFAQICIKRKWVDPLRSKEWVLVFDNSFNYKIDPRDFRPGDLQKVEKSKEFAALDHYLSK
jgi:hypothetical protein